MAHSLSRRKFIGHAQGMVLATPFLSLMGCSDASQDLVTLDGKTMGTTYSVKLAGTPRGIDERALAQDIEETLESVNLQMSTYRPDSELSRFNAADEGAWVSTSADTRFVIDAALRVSRLTAGAFDPTVGPIVELWGFGAGHDDPQLPSPEDAAAAREVVGFSKVETRSGDSAVAKQTRGVNLDLSGIAKGFGVDKVAEYLEREGVENYLVEVGGELRSKGVGPGGKPWRVGIERPSGVPGDLQQVIELKGEALATSGNYRIFFEQDGRRYSHIIDPRTGRPVEHSLASATVVAPTTMEADALSTSLLVLGPDAGMKLAVEQDIAAFFITGNGESLSETSSPAFARRFKS
ncbi:FAD:protein FMN transferase [Denitrobaculum tricleocarpae]|nr:FAD:protein FMN transferase [Denitrobaculum tricleocarpae]